MSRSEATEQYNRALKMGQKEYKDRVAKGLDPNPAVLNEVLGDLESETAQYVGQVEIPMNQIVGTKTVGRTSAFTASFLPLLEIKTEFANKWIELCSAHLEEGIRDPIVCYEYLGNFYVQEGNKRVSVLRSYDAPRIPAIVYRILPPESNEPRIRAYYEFLDFYKLTGLYCIQFTQPGNYAKLTKALGMTPGEAWPEEDRRRFRAYFQYFREAFNTLGGGDLSVRPEDALLLWLELYPYEDLGKLSSGEIKERLSKLWKNVMAISDPEPVVRTEPPAEPKSNILTKIIRPDHLNVAFVHQGTAAASPWTNAHENGRRYLEEALGKAVTTRSYQNANTPEQAEELLQLAVAEGADVIFTTAPQLIAPSLKISVKYPRLRVMNCSVHMPYSTVRTYYSRIYEGKFITGAIAGAMAKNDRIGYVGSSPIHGVPASINAFALGAQMTNPRATIELRWSCQPGNPTKDFLQSGIRVVSNRDTPSEDQLFTEYGTYIYDDEGKQCPLASPVWVWGKFYEQVVRSILAGGDAPKAGQVVNDWWGMSSGVIDVKMSDKLPEGVRSLAQTLRTGLQTGILDPFARKIIAQDGTEKNDGTGTLTADELLHMDWLCQNVHGSIPAMEEILPFAQPMVKLLGVYPEDKEGIV